MFKTVGVVNAPPGLDNSKMNWLFKSKTPVGLIITETPEPGV